MRPLGCESFLRASEKLELSRIATIQNTYHLMNRTLEAGLAEICLHENSGLLPYSPLAFGLLTGKYLDGQRPDAPLTRFPNFGRLYDKPNAEIAAKGDIELAHRYGLVPSEMAITFALRQPPVSSVIIGVTKLEQLTSNIRAAQITLPDDLLQEINTLHRKIPNPTS